MADHRTDPAFLYEDIIRKAFDCRKAEDPLGLAKQEVYNHGVGDDRVGFRLKLGLSAAAFKMSQIGEEEHGARLAKLSELVWSVDTQNELLSILHEVASLGGVE